MDVNKNGLAEVLEVSTVSIDNWLKKGLPYVRKAKRGVQWKFNVAATVQWLMAREAGRFDSKDLTAERTRETRLRADLLQCRLDLEQGRALPLEETQLVWTNIVSSARAKFLSLPSKLAPQAVGMTAAEIQELAQSYVYEALDDLGSGDELPEVLLDDVTAEDLEDLAGAVIQ